MNNYCEKMFSIVRDEITVILLKYPIGMQSIPLTAKFGLNTPSGGFLEDYQVKLISSILEPSERAFLKSISDNDPYSIQTLEYFDSLPDISDEEMTKQVEEFEKNMKKEIRLNDSHSQ